MERICSCRVNSFLKELDQIEKERKSDGVVSFESVSNHLLESFDVFGNRQVTSEMSINPVLCRVF